MNRKVIFPGSATFGIKDPMIVRDQDLRIWATEHPLTEGDDNADRMVSVNAFRYGEEWYRRYG